MREVVRTSSPGMIVGSLPRRWLQLPNRRCFSVRKRCSAWPRATPWPRRPLLLVWTASVSRWTQRYLAARNPQDLGDAPRSGRPRLAPLLTEKLLAQILAQDPRQEGYQATTWTAPLLATHLRQHYQCSLSESVLFVRRHASPPFARV
jgi:hypothetical protein